MTTIGLCTHFSENDRLAFEFALDLAKKHQVQLNICHWLNSPYILRRDIVQDDLFSPGVSVTVTSALLTRLEYQLRAYYEPLLGDFTNVAFKLCEGHYQVELLRCFRQQLLDLVALGDQPDQMDEATQPLADFAAHTPYPLVIVQASEPRYRVNQAGLAWLDFMELPEHSWEVIESAPIAI